MTETFEARLDLGVRSTSPSDARRFVTDTLIHWRADRALEVATLLTSELVTNALLHAGSAVHMRVRLADRRVRVEVHDHSSEAPVRRHSGAADRGGRGMMLVDALSSAWGVDPDPGDGKTVWFEVTT